MGFLFQHYIWHLAFLYSVFHIPLSCLWPQMKQFKGHEFYFCIILWFRDGQSCHYVLWFRLLHLYFYWGLKRVVLCLPIWSFSSNEWPLTLSGGDGQQSHGVFTAQQTGQLYKPNAGRPRTRGSRWRWRCQEANSQGKTQRKSFRKTHVKLAGGCLIPVSVFPNRKQIRHTLSTFFQPLLRIWQEINAGHMIGNVCHGGNDLKFLSFHCSTHTSVFIFVWYTVKNAGFHASHSCCPMIQLT